MKKLSEIPFEDVYIGMPVLSTITNRRDKVTDFRDNTPHEEDKEIAIVWDAAGAVGCKPRGPIYYWQFWLDNVVILEG